MKKHEFKFESCIDGAELTQFIENNSDKEWNVICDIEREFQLYGDEGRCFGRISYNETLTIYKSTPNKIFFQEMINKFFEVYELDKTKSVVVLFED